MSGQPKKGRRIRGEMGGVAEKASQADVLPSKIVRWQRKILADHGDTRGQKRWVIGGAGLGAGRLLKRG